MPRPSAGLRRRSWAIQDCESAQGSLADPDRESRSSESLPILLATSRSRGGIASQALECAYYVEHTLTVPRSVT